MRWQYAVDFVVLAAAVYILLQWAKGTRALRVVLAIFGLHALARVAWQVDLTITGWLLNIASGLLVLMLLFFFQPELRHAYMWFDGLLSLGRRQGGTGGRLQDMISRAAFAMAADRVGALIVIARKDSMSELVSGGTPLGAEVSPEILAAIFNKQSPIHDGALLIEGERISRAGVVLPLTQSRDVPSQYGTRHRAAMGMAERCDALVVVVSEERGEVTLMNGLEATLAGTPESLAATLESLTTATRVPALARLRRWLFADMEYKLAAASIAAVLWLMSIMGVGAMVRTVSVPVEFSGVPAGMEITSQSATHVEVQLRGASWLLSSLQLTRLVARCNVGDTSSGAVTLKVGPANLDLPPGVTLERVRPEVIKLRLTRAPG
ncbi:MAG TPA: diadenylate cyclase [Bryobacteraceae bacterium]|nr:diadenylate cyclase [Bryobacteraceae bacterium]